MNRNAYISIYCNVQIGDRVRIGERVSIHDENHVYGSDDPDDFDKYLVSGVEIGDDVWIGAGSVILAGSRVGAGSVVAAGSVVRGEFPARSLIGGIPARVLRTF